MDVWQCVGAGRGSYCAAQHTSEARREASEARPRDRERPDEGEDGRARISFVDARAFITLLESRIKRHMSGIILISDSETRSTSNTKSSTTHTRFR